MFKKIIAICLCSMLMLFTFASAEEVKIIPKRHSVFEHQDKDDNVMSSAANNPINKANGVFMSPKLLPLSDDAVLLYGSFQYSDMLMEESLNGGYDRDMPRTDAYAIALDKAGARMWSLRLSDPESENEFTNAWITEDNRIMLKFNDRIGDWGTQYYIISQEGDVQEMLPAYKSTDAGINETLRPVGDGILGGGLSSDYQGYGPMENHVNIAFFDHNMNKVWSIDDERLLGAELWADCEVDGGIVMVGGIVDLTTITPSSPWYAMPLSIMVNAKGEIVWEYRGHEDAVGPFQGVCSTNDGGVLLTGWADPTEETLFNESDKGTITKLDDVGNHVWTKQYYDDYGFLYFDSIIAYKDGYVASGFADEQGNIALLYFDTMGSPIEKVVIDVDADSTYLQLVSNEFGAYFYGGEIVYSNAASDTVTVANANAIYLPLANIWKWIGRAHV